jgi:saccharopine dehydrogenase (NAD+, L-lysine-forming)
LLNRLPRVAYGSGAQPCLKSRTHYLDILARSTSSFRRNAITQKRVPRNRNLPGVGFDVIPTDFIAAMLKKALPDAWRARPFR